MYLFFVLVWRHLRSRLNSWAKSCIEILLPAIILIGFFFIKDKHNVADDETVQYTESVSISDFYTTDLVLCYPQTPITESLMEEAAGMLKLKYLVHKPVNGKSRGYHFISNATLIPSYAEALLDDEAIIIFQNVGSVCPEKLNYTIKMKNDFKTTEYLPQSEHIESHSAFGTMYESFLKLQWAVDKAFLRQCLGTDISQTLKFQELPSRAYTIRVNVQVQLFILAFQVSMMTIFIFHTARIMEERMSGMQELVKSSGVSTFMVGLGHFVNTFLVGVVVSIVGMLVLKLGSIPVLARSNCFLLWVALVVTVSTFIVFSFLLAHALPLMKNASSSATFGYILLIVPSLMVLFMLKKASLFVKMLTGILPMVPLNWIMSVTTEFETEDSRGLTFSTLFTRGVQWNLSPMHGYIALALQLIIYSLLTYYVSLVRPGRNGVGAKWNFMYTNICTNELKEHRDPEATELRPSKNKGIYFENSAPPSNHHGIRLHNVSKSYGKTEVLKDITMNVYEGEITVLLGHNGAGKTTLMTLAAGLLHPTSGEIYIEGFNVQNEKAQVTKLIGMCPQDNICFKDLNVLDHVMFFTMIRKNVSLKDAKQTSKDLLGRLHLSSKEKSFENNLSGGMKRRLQLCMAMAGDARVLVLDEPTSGLDVETRRDLWNLLLTLRGNRTVILSTHFMEEADALGDRIAALHSGELKCYATSMFLKKAIGEGYRLTLVTKGAPKEPDISDIIFQVIPTATVKEKTTNSLSYNLPSSSASKFVEVFERLEDSKAALGIESIGMGTTTLDEVFMRLCADTIIAVSTESTTTAHRTSETEYKRITGCQLILNQTLILIWRHFKYLIHAKYHYVMIIVVSLLFICLSVVLVTNSSTTENLNENRQMDLTLFKDLPAKRVLVHATPHQVLNLLALQEKYPDVKFESVSDIVDSMLRTSKEKPKVFKEYLMGLEINRTHVTVLYSTYYRHVAPAALNLLSNAIALNAGPERTAADPAREPSPVSVFNDPVRGAVKYAPDDNTVNVLPTTASDVTQLSRNIPTVILLSVTWCLAPLFLERDNSQRHILHMSGCDPAVYWTVTLAYFTTVFSLPLIPGTVIFLVIFDKAHTFAQLCYVGSLAFIILISIIVFLSFLFWLSETATEKEAYFTALVVVILQTAIPNLRETIPGFSFKVLDYVLMPLLFHNGMKEISNTARVNAFCSMNRHKCPDLKTSISEFVPFLKQCCERVKNPANYFNSDVIVILILLFIHLIIYMTLTICARRGIFQWLFDKVYNKGLVLVAQRSNDLNIEKEMRYVAAAIKKNASKTDVLLVNNLHKRYSGGYCGTTKINALQGIDFSIKQKECFAILGVNGAGKSTMFQAITAEQAYTCGEVRCDGHPYKSKKYLQSLGYCPQHNSMDTFLTGRENLELLLKMRGFSKKDAKAEADNLLSLLALDKHGNKKVYKYSGGCKRRLCAGGALCGRPALAVLDEPSAGVDVAARRALWSALRHSRAKLVASHSMEEVEALASRLLILVGGRVRAIGSPDAVRAAHANGHSLRILLNTHSLKKDEIALLKDAIHSQFNCTLKDEHKTMLFYHIDVTMRYSEIFGKLEEIKRNFPILLVDYSVQETTLEEVFLSFAKDSDGEESSVRGGIRPAVV